MGSYASVGFNALQGTDSFREFENYGLSRTVQVGFVACNHTRLNRPWTNVIYRIGVSVDDQRSSCLARLSRDEEIYPVLSEFLPQFSFLISDCPCTLFQAARDNRFTPTFFCPSDMVCAFNQFATRTRGVPVFFANRCCYSLRYVCHTQQQMNSIAWFLEILQPSWSLE